jgi:hypothetical protein
MRRRDHRIIRCEVEAWGWKPVILFAIHFRVLRHNFMYFQSQFLFITLKDYALWPFPTAELIWNHKSYTHSW